MQNFSHHMTIRNKYGDQTNNNSINLLSAYREPDSVVTVVPPQATSDILDVDILAPS